jgi:hypothetical protein
LEFLAKKLEEIQSDKNIRLKNLSKTAAVEDSWKRSQYLYTV